ncbi:hyperosmolarity resistance protein Ebh, partial [Staphylococcus aureus]|uniref:hyperosmolarity resistance protein Ebh n=1 Tax=Staphylococcus aureus TaxID=1280 RepID=UPI003523B39F
MNYRDKIQKFSIRKYTVGTFSTVIATLVFLGFNTSQAHAAETNQPASVVKQKQQSNNEQTENRESQVQNSQNSQNSQSLSATHENEQPNNSQANLVNQKVAQSSTTNDEQPASQNVNTKKDSATAATTQPDKEESKHKQNESQSANKNGNDNRAAHVENHEANVVTASDSSDNGNVQHDRNELQAFFDANYHDYRFIDRENADSGTFNYVKGIFDKINTLLGSNDPINNKDLQLAYKELEQAVALIRTMPQRQQTSRRSNRIQTRSVESRAAEPRSVSDYQNANSSYYVENANDGSGYPVGTYINASSKGAPYNLPTTPWNTLKASDSKEIALMTAKQTGDGYQWVIKFNKGHAPHQNMIFWFALPADQVPVGRTDFVTVNSDGTNVQWSHGAGAGANKPLQQMWEYGVNDPDRSHDFKIRNRSGQVIYSWPTVHVYSLEDLSRASDYFSEAGATPATKAFGRQNFEYINGQKPAESPGVPKVYTFIGQGDASYTISFKTQGPTVNKLYYAAGGRALEYNQLFMYSQLYVESTQDHQQRLNGLRQVVNRTYRIGTTKRVEVSQGNVQTKKVLESTNLNIDDFVDDPLSYVKTPSNKVLGFYPTNANTNAFRPGGVQELNEYQLSQLFTDQKLQEAARTRNPIRLMIGFDYPDGYGNSETLVPVNLTVLPEIQHNIKFFKNDDTQNIAEKPFSKQAGHPVFYVYAGNQGNASVNLGGSVTSIQPLRINLTSNENFTDKDWQITGIPRTLHIENSTNRTNNARERNIELVGNLLPGDYFGTIRFGRKEQLFEIRVKPHTPTITTTAEQLRGTALQKVPVNISGIPLDPSALVYLVAPTNQTTNGGSEADQIPSGYTILATGTPDGVHNTITIRPQDYVVFIPPVGKQIRAVVYYNKVVASNMSNAVTILPDDIPPTINNPVGINAKYYRGDEVNFTMGVSDRHSGIKNTTITTLPSGWTSNLTKSDNKNGSLAITGRVSMNQAFNSDITFKVSATDNVNNTTNDSQSKHVSIHVGKISEDAHPIVLGNTEKVVVVNPTAVSNDEKQSIITAFMNKNQNIRGYLASTDPVTVDNNGNVTLHYRDGSSTTLDATNVMTYEPVVKSEYQTANAAKTATVTIAKGQSFNIGDIKQYFTLSNGQAIPNGTFTNITSDRTIPTAQEVSQMNAGTQLYHIVASNAYHKDTEDFYISLKIVDVKQPEGDQRVYRTSTYDLTTDEISKVKQAFINANRDVITLAEGDISVTNTPNGANVSTITVNINKGRLTKSFASNLANMNFLRWVNFPQDYTVTWTNAKIANRPTDGGLSWSDDHKSLIYRYDATLGTQITTNDILTMLKATTTVPGLRNNITGNEKAQAEAGGRPNYRTTGYSQSNATTDGQRQFTLNGQVIQILDIINPSNGYGGQPVTNSNTRANHSNSTVVNVNEPAANGAGAFTIDHVVKSNSTHNASDAVYKAQLYLTPYGPKQYVEHLNQNTGNTTDAINIYFVPSDLVNPTISVGNYTNHQVFSGETFTNTITANDNFGVQSVTVPNTSQITGTVDNNHQHVSATAPNVTSATSKTINLLATDTSGNTATTSFNVTVKPLRDKYRVGTSSTAANPVRIANISNNATVSQADQTTIINSLTFTSNAPNRNYATASANEITSKTVSNVSRTGNNANVTVTVTHQDGTTSTVTVPVKHVIPEIVAHSHYTVQGQDFPAGNGSSAADYFKLSNGSAIPDATITWVSGQAPNKDNTRIGEDITVTAHILIDGETTPITKTATYKVVRTVPKHVFETARGVLYPGVSDMYDAKQYVKPVNNSWSTNAQHMNFQFVGTYGPNKDVVGISTRLIRVTYDNRQTEDLTILSKVKPDPPRIDANSVTYKAGLTNQEIKVNNVLNNSSVKLFKADNTPLNVTNITHGSGFSSVVTVSDALPNGGIKAKSSISMNNVTYTTQDEHGQVVTVTRNESVDSNDSASVTVTPQLQATTEGAVFIKGGDGFDFGHVERFIQNPPHGATVAWHDSPDTWKNTVGNTHKTAVVTLPSGQGTRNVEVPVKVYPVANAKAPSRDVKGQNLTHGTNAIDYITFDPNTNTNGITAAWANRQQPNNQQAGVQHLNVDVTYPGISAAKRVPVTVNVYQFEFPQTTYTTTVGGTLASGTQASGYAHMQNASGLPTDGFTYKWNRDTTGTNDANWAAMNKPNTAQVVNAKYDVIYNGHTFATSLPAKFVVKDVQPAKPTVTETAAGAITIAPGANQTVNTHAGNVTTYADKLVIKRNGNVVTTFTRRNNTSPWVKEASAANVTGIVGTNNGITVAAGTFNPADTIQVVATQGSGETISDEQRSDDFTVVAPQPNQATTKIWQNGHIDITPNNPSGHLINPTQAMDIAYTEKVGNGAEHSKTINVVRGQNNQWTIANKPDYVTLDAQTGKVTFNANTIKPNSSITITPKAGTGHSVSSNPSTLTAPAAHTVNTTEIVKDYGSNVTAAEINNAVQVANKRTATIKNGTAMPTNLAGGSTTTIPVTVTYNDGSTEEVQESIFTKADKRELITAKNHLDDPVSTEGKKPGTITQYNNAMHNAQQQINTAKTEAQQVINNERATPQQVSDALTKVRAAQTKIDQAKALLQNKEDNSQLVTSKNNLQSSVNQVPSTAGMTQQSIDNYNAKKREAETEITAAQRVIDNGDATAQQISDEKHRVDNALTALNQAKHDLTADTHALEQAVQQLNRTGTTTGKKPASITAYNNSIRALQSDLTSAKNSANAIIQKPIRTVQEVQSALTNVNRVNERLTQAINQLVPLADNSALRTAKTKLDEEINKSVTTDGMTQSSIQAYENAKRAGQTETTNAQNVINNGDATDQQIAAEKTKVEEKYNSLKQAIAGLTPDLAPLQTAKTQLQNDIDQPTSTTGMTSASVAAFNDKLSAARTKIQEIDRVLASHPDVATIRQNVTAANAAKTALDQARNGLTVDKAPLENAKNQLQHSIDTQTSTTGMTQDSINAYNAKLTAARNKVQQINQVLAGSPTVDQINTNTSAANQAKSDLDHARQALTPDKAPLQNAKTQLEQSINQPTDTTGMTTASLNAYNQKLQAARQKLTEINQVLNGNPTVQNINDKVAEANQAKDQLNTARQGLTLDRQPALTTLHGASNLNQAQQNNFTQQINAAQNHAALETIKSNITALNTAMTKLKDSVADNNTIKSGQNYTDATPANKQAYDNAVNAAKGVIGETTNPTMDVNTVNQKAASVKSTKDALDGQQNLQRAKTEATNAITHASDLNQAQKNALTQQVNSAQNVQAVNDIKQTTQSLNTAMTGLKRGVANHNQVVQSDNYVNADTNKKNDYNNAYNHANDIINGNAQHPVITPSDVNNALSNVTSKEHALNGEAKLNAAKQEANTALGHLNNLNNVQRQNLQSQINGAHQIDAVNTIKQNATNLNSAMGNLRQAVADKDQVKRTEDYADADTAKQNAYNSAVSSAETIINQTANPTMSVDDVNRATSAVTTNKNALNGDEKLVQSKTDAARAIDALPHLNNAQKADVKSKINAASNIAGVNTVKQQGTDLNTAMGNLQGAINDEQTTLNSQNYQDADDAKRTAYSQAVNAAATILNKTAGGNTPKADVERAMQAVTQANTALNGIQNLERAKQAANTAITNASDLNTKQKEALKAQVTSAGRVSAANGVEHTATELNTAMTALKRAIADKADTKASGNYVNADANKRQAYDEKVTAAEHIVSGTPTPTLTPSDVTNAATQVTNAKTQLNGNHNLEVAKQNANTAIDGLTSLNGPQKAKLKEQVGQATTLPNVQTVRDNAQTLNTAMKGLRDSIANEATIKAGQNYTDASQNKQNDYNNAVTAAKAIIGQTTSPSMITQEINQAKDQVTVKQQALNGQENLRTAQTNAKQHLNGLSDLTNAQKDAAKRQIEGATHVNEVTQAQNNADALNTAMTNLKNGIQDQNTIKQGVNFTDADEAKRNAYTNAVTQAEQILNKAQGPNTAKDGVETALQNVQRAKNELNGNQNVANAKTTAKNALNNLTSINNAQKAALKSQIEGATTVAGVNQVSTMASELNTAMSNLQRGINDEAATKAAQKYTEADRDKQTAYNDAVTAAKTLLDKTAGSNDNKVAVEQALQRVNTAKTALNGDARLNEAKNTAKQQLATMSHLTNAQKANLTEQIERGTTVAGVQGIQANAGTLNQAMNQLRQSIASKDATKSSEDYQDANADLQNAYNDAVTNAEGIISATNNPEMNPDTINQKASQVNSAKSALNGDEKLAAAKQTAKSDIGRLTDLNNAQRTAANAEVDQAPNLAAVTAAKNKATSLNTAMGNLKHALAEKDNTKRSVNYTDADQPKQQAYDTAVTQAEAITNANGSNANETQVQAALNQLNQAKNDLNGDNKVAQAKETAKRALASYSNLNNAQSTAATSQIDNATTVADVTAAQNTANELNTAMGQLQNGINDQNTVKQQVNFTDADQGKKDAYTNAVTNAQGILDKANGQNMTKAQVEAALNQVTTAKNALNGDANVRQAKSDAKANLGTLTHLNNAQKQDLTSQIEGATTVNGVNSVKTKAQDLDGAMQRLESAIANKDQTKASENYIDADPTKKTAFDNAITQAESYLNKDHGTNKDKQAVEQAIQSVTSTENALNGDANLQRAKTEATQAIDNLTQLNTPQKTALKQQVNAAQRVSGVTDLKNSATSLNNAMDQLKQAIGDHDTIVAGGNYTNASPDKQGAYTDAYNAAKNIVNGSPNVITNAADVTAATQRVNNAETSLNGDTNLATAKQQAKDALRQMTHLSDAQKQSITGQIDSATQVTGVQSVKDNATNLDNAMNQLRNSIANKDEVKASQPYVDADTDKQNAYNTAVTSAENIINATSQPTLDPSAVTQAANQVNTNKTALNGAQNLANKKQETTANINRLSHLNNAQKQDLNTQVTNAPNISTVNQVKTKAEQLDQAMERLINGIQDKDQVKQSVNFTDADPEKQTAYNNAVTAAENIINQANGTNANQSQVEAALSTVTTTKQALNGDRKVTDAKNNANQTLSTLDNLNNAQKGAVTGNINQAHTVAEVTQAIQTAQELNTAMGNLKNSLNDKDTTLGSQNFADADPEKKNAYNEAVRNAENILNKSTGTNVPKDQVEAAMNQVNTTKAALNGTQNLEKAKQHANTAIDGLSHLTNAQKEALKQLVQQSTTVAEAQGNEQKANNVDAAMDKLRQSIADNATTKQNQNYTDASPNKKDAYNNAVTTAQGIIDQTTNPSLDPTVINQAAGQVSTSKNALNGNENLEAAKQQATQSLGSLDNLNNAQKQAVTNQINGAHTVDEANQIKQNAQNLNTAMGNLKQAIADKDATKATVNFTDADQAKQQTYNTAVTNAENIISKANGGNATQTEVEQAIQQVNAAKQALNGNANVQHAKDEATALINNSNDLNQAQKDALKQQVQNATTVAGVNNVKQTAQELNNAMTQLKQGIADKEQTKADGNFVNADSDKQNAYNQAVAKAEALISGTPDVVVTPSEITAALNKVTQAKNDLNGNTNLATAKQNVQHAIDQLPNLNQAQRDEYSKQITQATLVPNVNAIQQAATTLNDAMTQLKQGIANKAQIKGSENYHDADTDKQTAYDNAVTKAEELLKQTTNPTMDPNTIQQALTKVNDTNQALNGNQKLADAKQDAKTTLGTLDHLNDAQKQALTTQVEQAPDIATVNNVKQNAQNLNNAMTNLNNALQDKTETLNSINFTDADQAKKDDYTNAVSHAEGILSKANGSNASQTEVEQAMQRVNEAKQALNGNDNVQRAKDAAKQVITNANDLNQAQKDALKQQVDAAQTVANVNTIKQTAQDLNQAMTQLKQGIADKDQTKANGNFVNADTDKQNAYNNAVAHAEQIISGTPNANVDPQQVAQALQQVNQAKGDLNGNHNLQVAKDNANTAIDQLPNLNQPQKTALKDQVSHAELVTGVNAIKQNADALNNAMGTLKQQIQANSQVPQSVDFTQADQDKQQAYNNAANQAQQIANGTPTPVLAPDTVTKAVTTMNQAKDALNGDEKLAQAKQDALANLDTLRDLNQPQRDALRNQINQAQALATVEQTKQNAQNVNTAMGNLKQGIANKDTVKASENYHDADVDKQTAYTNAVSQAEGIINQTTNPTLNPDDITRALTQVTDAKNSLNGEAKLATEKQNAKDAVSGMTHLNDAQKQALKGQIDQSPEIATVNQVKQTATSLDQAMDQLSQAINDKDQILADGNYLNADPDKQNAYKQAVAKAEALLNKQSGTNEVQAQVESITNEVNAAKQALNGNDNLANAKQQAKQQLANLTHLNDAQKQSFESQITQAPLVTDVTTINQKAQTLDHAMELLRNSVADNQTTLASEDYHDATAQRQNDYNKAVTAANNIINQTTSPTMNPDDVNGATTQVNNTKVALDGDENLAAAKQQANNRLDQLDHLNNAQKQQLQSQITQSSDIAAVNGHKQTAESLNTAMGNLINAIADHQAVEQRGNFINADTDKQTAYNTAVNEAAAMINKQTGQNANQTEVEQAITKVQTTLQALNGDHNLQVAKTNATQAIDALTSLNDPQKTALKDQVTAATLVTAVHQIEQNANTLNQAMHALRQSIQDNAATKANSKYINEDQPEQQNYDQAVQAANNIINEQTATLDNNAINQVAATVNTTKAALHGDVKLQNDKDHAKQTVSQLAHLNNAQKHMEDTLIDSETTRTAVKQDLTEVQALDQLMDALQQSIADKDATRASSAYVNAEPNKKQAYDEAVQNAESIIAGLNNPTINKGNVSSATQAVISSKNALDGVERLAQDKQTAGNSLNHLDQLTPAQQQALENQINNATTRDKVAEIIAQAQALNEAMKALKESIKDQPQTEASSKFINEDQAQKDAYTQAVQHAKDLINKTTDPTLAKSIIDQATQAVTDAKNNLHGDQKLAQDKQRATETLNNLSNLNTPQRQALENQINNAATRGEVAQKLTEAQALNQAMEALRNSIQDQQQTESGSKFINEDKPQKDAYQAAVQNAKDLINQTGNPTLDKAQVEQLTHAFKQAKDNLHGDQKLADDKQHAVTDLNQLNGLNNPQRQALESQINNAATRGEVAQKLAEAKALDQAMQALRNSIQDQQQTEAGSKFINEDKPQKDAYQAAVQNAKDLINQTGNPTLDKSQVEQLTQAVTTAKDNLHGDQKLARDQQQAVTTVNALPNLNHAQQQTLTDAINAAPTRTEVAQHVQTATELDHAMETLKNKVDQVNTDKAQPNYTEASTDKKEAVDQALQAAQSITDPTNGSNANKDAVEQALTKLQEKVNELNGNERVAEAKTQAKQTIDQLTHLNADQIATAKQNIDQATKLQPIAELVDQATQLNQSMDQLQQAVNEHANVEQTIDYTQADSDKQKAYKQAIADAENVLKQNANKQQVDQALQNILNAKQALNGDERVALAKTNGKHDIDQLNALNNAQQDGFKGRIDQSNDLNQIQQIVDEAKALNRAMDQLSQEITGNEGRTKGSTNYVNADTQVKQVYDEAVDKAKQALDKSSGQNLTAEQVIKLNDAVTAAKKALNGEERLNNRKAEALQRLDQLTHLNNAQRQLAIQQINNAETLNKASRAINRATKLDNAMGAVQQYIDEQHLGVISSTNYINADDNLKANYDNAIANAAHELDKVQGNAIAKAEAEQLKQNIIDAQNALNGDQNLANAKDKANAFVNSLNGLNQQQQDLAHKAINNADTVSDVTDIVNNQIDLNDAMETLKHLVDNEIPNAEQTVNYQNADDNAKTNFDDAKRLANTLLNSDNTNVNDINGAIQAVNDAIHNLNGDQRLQDAKDKAIQSINQALANKLKEIEASNATDQDKLIAKNKAEELANSIINNINKATSNQAVSQVQTAGNHAIEQVHANEIPKAKIDANKDVDKQVQALIDEIDRNPNLTDKEKQALKDRINQILQQGHNDINNALTKEEIEQAKAQLAQALQDIKDLVKAKEDAKQDVDKQVQALIDEID